MRSFPMAGSCAVLPQRDIALPATKCYVVWKLSPKGLRALVRRDVHEFGRAPLATTFVLHGSLGNSAICSRARTLVHHAIILCMPWPESKTRTCCRMLFCILMWRPDMFIHRMQSPHVITISVLQSPRRAHASFCAAILPSCFHACFCLATMPSRFLSV